MDDQMHRISCFFSIKQHSASPYQKYAVWAKRDFQEPEKLTISLVYLYLFFIFSF